MGWMRRSRGHAAVYVWAATTLVLSSCQSPVPATLIANPNAGSAAVAGGPAAPSPGKPTGDTGRPAVPLVLDEPLGKLVLDLPDPRTVPAPVTVDALPPLATEALLARMEPAPVLDNTNAPPLRAPTPAPPRGQPTPPIAFVVTAGKPVADLPPGSAPPPTAPTHPLGAPQITPQGEVRNESEIRVRFDEPMVPVARVGATAVPPVTITPAAPGTWRWLDTRVLELTAAGARLQQATDFTVTVPAGTTALSGDALAAPASQTFSTPPVALAFSYPQTLLRTDSAIAVELDQDIDPARIAPLLSIDPATPGGKRIPVHVVDRATAEASWRKNPSLHYDSAQVLAQLGDRAVYLAPDAPWPSNLHGRITLAAGAPSREGTRVSKTPSYLRFDVAPELRVVGLACDAAPARMAGAACSAFGSMEVELSTELQPSSYRAQAVQIQGEPFADNAVSGSRIALTTPEKVGRGYVIDVAGADFVDVYGQKLVGPRRITFTTTRERFEPQLSAQSGLQVLDPRFEIPQWVIETQEVGTLHVELYQVQPADYFAYEDYEAGARRTPPGRRIVDKYIEVGARHGVSARIDLRPVLNRAGLGHVIAVATIVPLSTTPDYFTPRVFAWFQVTKLGLVGRVDGDQAHAWVRDISPTSFLAPTPGATATLVTDDHARSGHATTDAEGHAVLALLPPAPPRPETLRAPTHASDTLLEVHTPTDSAFTAIAGGGHQAVRERNALWYATDDRFMYKPGETAYVKGWVRWTTTGVNPDIALPAAGDKLAYTVTDSRGTKIASGTSALTDQGGFDMAIALPDNANLGTATVHMQTQDQAHTLPLSIEEFRTPAFAVTLNDDVMMAGAVPLVVGEQLEMRAEAKYYAGGGLPSASIRWDATLQPTRWQPPGRDEFHFQPPSMRSARREYAYRRAPAAVTTARDTTLTSASVAGALVSVPALPAAWPALLTVDATVQDVDRMAIRASSRPILVHPSDYYVGVRLQPGGNDDRLELIVSDIDGALVPGVPITIDIEGVLGSERARDDAKLVDEQHCTVTSAAAPVTCAWHRGEIEWSYTATAHVADRRGRANASQYDIPWIAYAKNEPLRLTPDRAGYRPGDVAKIALVSDVVPATAIVTYARNGVIAQKRLELTAQTTMLELPIEPAFISSVHVDVDRIAKRRSQLAGSPLPLPEHVQKSIELPVSIESARLVMTTRATKKIIEPGADATFEVDVKRDGKPVPGAEVALIVVDEAILALSSRTHGDPLPSFYRELPDGTSDFSTFEMVMDDGDELAGEPGIRRFLLDRLHPTGGGSGYGSGMGAGSVGTVGFGRGGGGTVVQSRKDFRANAVFSPRLHTDAAGRVSLTVKMPDSLTRFRIVAVATAGTRFFGKAEGTIVTQRKLNARTVAPRFLTQGDAFALPIVVQNLDSEPRTVDVAVRAVNLVGTGPAGKRVVVGPGQRAELRFDFHTQGRGRAVVQTIATSGDFADASTVQLPVYEPATTEAFATYGIVDDAPKTEQLAIPADIFPDVGGVSVQVASSQLQGLTDAFGYLYAYPYECAEQRSARMLATQAMADVLDAFQAPGRPARAEIEATLAADQARLARDQLPDGGWGYWPESRSDPYVTQQVLRAVAGAASSKPNAAARARAITYVTRDAATEVAALDRRLATPDRDRDPREQGEYAGRVSMAAADLAALAVAGADVLGRAQHLHAVATALGAYPIDAKARLLALVAGRKGYEDMRGKLLAQLLSATHETAASATVTASFGEAERMLLVSSTKSSALALEAIMLEAPGQAIVSKLARGLLEARRRGRWSTTQENLAVLTAMRHFFETYEKATPAFTGRVWLGGVGYSERAFAGHSTETAEAKVGWPALPAGTTQDLAFAKAGTGRMYYRVGITYAPKQVDLPALEAGFLVRRSYAAVDDPADVTRDRAGHWHIKLGARVLVTLEALNTTRRYDVALVDPLPAGLEPVNPRLAVAERPVPGATTRGWDHVNMRDERAEAFAGHLQEGSHVFAYSARATTPGTFVAAPAKAEEMYAPETFGRSTGAVVIVE